MQAEQMLQSGRLDEALEALTRQVRDNPADAELRVFLFQLLAVVGRWERAMTQLNVAAEMDPANLLMAQVCRAALNCEAFRAQVFAGVRSPMVFGEPDEWVGWMVQANVAVASGDWAQAADLRGRAFDAAPATPGLVDGRPFAWIADADSRLGPVLEAIFNGRYYWVPFNAVASIDIEAPADLRDMVWIPAQFTWANGGQMVGLIPTRYPGSEDSADASVRLARKTEWTDQPGETYLGSGQRMLVTDGGEYPLLTIRRIELAAGNQGADDA